MNFAYVILAAVAVHTVYAVRKKPYGFQIIN